MIVWILTVLIAMVGGYFLGGWMLAAGVPLILAMLACLVLGLVVGRIALALTD